MPRDAGLTDDSMSVGNDSQNRKRTSRVQLACDPCRAGKVKCDRTLPVCEQCFKRSRESMCKYKDNGMRYLMATQHRNTMREKMERLEQVVNRLQGTLSSQETSSQEPFPVWPPAAPNDVLATVPSGRMEVLSNGRTQWTGLSHWQSLSHDIADVKDYIGSSETTYAISDDFDDVAMDQILPDADVLTGTSYLLSVSDLLKLLPAKAEIDRYVSTWFSMPEPTRIIVHAPKFQQEYSEFWDDTTNTGPAWLALFLVIGCLGAELLGQIESDSLAAAQANMLRRLAAQALIRADTTSHQPHLIEALILYATMHLFQDRDVMPKTWHILGQVIRLCYQAGYHRDPSRNLTVSAFECEMRRRVWMVAQELEISTSCCMGMVSSVNPKLSDTRLPANYLDSDFSPTRFSPPRFDGDYTLVQVEVSFFSIVQVLGDVAMATHCRELPSVAEIAALASRLEDARDRLPERLQMVPIETSIIDHPSEIVDRVRIEFAYQRAVCLLYHWSLGQPNQQRESDKCEYAASSMIRITVDMLRAAQPGGKLAPLKLMLVRHIHDFNFAAMLLCTVLKHNASREPALKWDEVRCHAIQTQLIQACELWNSLDVPSAKARVALETITGFLNQPMRGTPSSTGPISQDHHHDSLQAIMIDSRGPLDPFSQSRLLEFNPLAFERGITEYGEWLNNEDS